MACQLSSLPHDLVPLVLDAVSEHDMRSLAVVSSDLSQAAHPRVQGAALDDFLGALIDVTQAYFEHDEFDPDFDWSDRCEWIAEWDSVPVDRVVAWLQALPKDERTASPSVPMLLVLNPLRGLHPRGALEQRWRSA